MQTFQRERPFPLSKTEAPFYLGLVVPSLCPNKILGIRPTHGQWTHINPHEKSSLVNCSLSPCPLSVFALPHPFMVPRVRQVKWTNCCHIAAKRKNNLVCAAVTMKTSRMGARSQRSWVQSRSEELTSKSLKTQEYWQTFTHDTATRATTTIIINSK